MIAGDTLVSGGGIHDCTVIKVARNERGDLAGASGEAVYCHRFLEWFTGGEKFDAPEVPEGGTAFIVRANEQGRVECWEKPGFFVVMAPYYAIGSGRELALWCDGLWGGSASGGLLCSQALRPYRRRCRRNLA